MSSRSVSVRHLFRVILRRAHLILFLLHLARLRPRDLLRVRPHGQLVLFVRHQEATVRHRRFSARALDLRRLQRGRSSRPGNTAPRGARCRRRRRAARSPRPLRRPRRAPNPSAAAKECTRGHRRTTPAAARLPPSPTSSRLRHRRRHLRRTRQPRPRALETITTAWPARRRRPSQVL